MKYLSEKQLEKVKDNLQTELLKRGYLAPISRIEEVSGRGGNRIEFETESFQTTPVLFKKLYVSNFNSGISEPLRSEDEELDFRKCWIQVSVRYENFSGGSNGTNLFDFHFTFAIGSNYIHDIKVL